jgi:hypothetical protein
MTMTRSHFSLSGTGIRTYFLHFESHCVILLNAVRASDEVLV